ncbi:glycosyl transferase group 1 [Thermocrinis albus DSM 14484]|uniref:Glycosyl transferase group 1 n=1 Tax=Thermocrinis albus (strain DSM 14484 / JCM 11386 / HI 11/12) TaxID=638303 RepID=D3SPY1_THEAH|nr:glycosyltransferase [Thermocrinis albus]ADC89218.1 glycosyl transferase group 1 [Thermocrinis albus DSM 14484]
MRILSVVDGVGWSGTKSQVYLLAKELHRRGVDITVALSYQYTLMQEKLNACGVKWVPFENHTPFNRVNPFNYVRLRSLIKEGGYHAVIANSPHALDFVRVSLALLRKKPKMVVVKRSSRKPNIFSLRFKYSAADAVVCVSNIVKEEMLKAGFPEEKLHVIYSAIETDRFRPLDGVKKTKRKSLGIPPDAFVFINVANWNPPVKGQDGLIRTFSQLSCDKCYLVLVGYKTEEEAKRVASLYGVEKKVIGLGFREDVEELLNMADAFVLSSHLEGLPNALLQAMACALPVISSSTGGALEVIREGVNGFIFPVGDWNALLKKMRHLLYMKEEERRSIGTRARETALEFSVENTAQKYIELLQKLI